MADYTKQKNRRESQDMSRKLTHLQGPQRALNSSRDYDQVSSGANQTRMQFGLCTIDERSLREFGVRRSKVEEAAKD